MLPKWQCHKVVEAFKIQCISPRDCGTRLIGRGSDATFSVHVQPSYMAKHSPQIGGYYVRYEDGYESFSPAHAFEAGYRPVEEKAA